MGQGTIFTRPIACRCVNPSCGRRGVHPLRSRRGAYARREGDRNGLDERVVTREANSPIHDA